MPDDPALLFGLKMAVCLALFLLGAAWLRHAIERSRRIKGPPPTGASASQVLKHVFGASEAAPPLDHERRLYRQTIRILATELCRLDPDHVEAHEALALLALDQDGAGDGASIVAGVGAPPNPARPDVRTQETQLALH